MHGTYWNVLSKRIDEAAFPIKSGFDESIAVLTG
jgi:hypothetical protein